MDIDKYKIHYGHNILQYHWIKNKKKKNVTSDRKNGIKPTKRVKILPISKLSIIILENCEKNTIRFRKRLLLN